MFVLEESILFCVVRAFRQNTAACSPAVYLWCIVTKRPDVVDGFAFLVFLAVHIPSL